MRVKILVAFCVGFLGAFEIDELANLVKHDIVGEFNQTKNIVNFTSPIRSSGEFSLLQNSFEMNTTKPIKTAVRVSEDGVFNYKNGSWVKNERASDVGLLKSIIRLDMKALKDEFEPSLSGDKSGWRLELLPKGFFVSKIFSRIEIWGDEYVKKIHLVEINGDETISEFSRR